MMERSKAWFYLGALALATVAVAPAPVSAQKPTKINGVIADRSGANMIVRTATGTTTVTLNNATKVEEKKGALKLKHSTMAATSLIPVNRIEGITTNLAMIWETQGAVALTSNQGQNRTWMLAEHIADLLAADNNPAATPRP